MDSQNNWSIDLLETLISEGFQATLGRIVENGPIHSGPVGLLWDETAESIEVLMLAQTLAEIGRTEEALEALMLVAQFQWSRAEAA